MSETISATINLPYFKQGDDLHACLVKKNDGTIDTKASLRNHIDLLQDVIAQLQAIHDLIPDQNKFDIHGDTHFIQITGDQHLIEHMAQNKLVTIEEFEGGDAEEDPFPDQDENDPENEIAIPQEDLTQSNTCPPSA